MAVATLPNAGAFGIHLRRVRTSREVSQERLALAAGISPRHMSFLETGRARPSRDVILRLGRVLDLSANQQNALLSTAGFAPVFAPGDIAPQDRTLALDALSKLLASQDPVPAIASDAVGDIIEMNASATRLFTLGMGRTPAAGENLFALFCTDPRLRASIANWTEVAPSLRHHLEQEALSAPDPSRAHALIEVLTEAIGPAPAPDGPTLPIFRFEIRLGTRTLRLLSNYSTFGAPYDATMQSIRIECFFPADDPTRDLLEAVNQGAVNKGAGLDSSSFDRAFSPGAARSKSRR
jgi:transcriptional regulator with XRE-family HTH domain